MTAVLIEDTQAAAKPRVRRMLEAVNRAVSRALDVPRDSVMVRYEPGKPANYWEGASGEVPAQGRRVFVTVKLPGGAEARRIEKLFGEIASSVAGPLNILPEAVWTQVEEIPADRAAVGAQTYADRRRTQ